MNIISIIPARMGSSRFPGKPMEKINGKPMIGHVYERVSETPEVNLTAVATCDTIIYDYISSIGGLAVMTGKHHERASDRCAEALNILEKDLNRNFDIIVMVQGDEPMVRPEMISQSIAPFMSDDIDVVNLMAKIKNRDEFEDKNCIKVVFDNNSNALYFSRKPIPSNSEKEEIFGYKQVCIIPFKRDYLLKYNSLKPTPLEIAESVDMLRVLEHGGRVKLVETTFESHAVDTRDDLRRVEKIMKDN